MTGAPDPISGDTEGAIGFAPLLGIPAENRHDGWLVIEAEQDPVARSPLGHQSLGLRTLKQPARDTGLATAAGREAG